MHGNYVTGHCAEQEFACNEILLVGVDVLNESECSVDAHDFAAAVFLFLTEGKAVLCLGYLSPALHRRNGVVELVYVKMLSLAVTQKLFIPNRLFARALELADYKL